MREITITLVAFLRDIGLEVRFERVEGPTQVPGIAIRDGVICVDESAMTYPGDLLHEGGHLAMIPASERASGGALESAGDEMGSIAWSYAAALHLGIDPAIVFHEGGYRGGSQAILENFAHGRTFGVPLLAWYGLTHDPQRTGRDDPDAYPKMLRWLRE